MSGKIYKFNKNNVFHSKHKYIHSYHEKNEFSHAEKNISESKSDSYVPKANDLLKNPPNALDMQNATFQATYSQFKGLEKGLKQEIDSVFFLILFDFHHIPKDFREKCAA